MTKVQVRNMVKFIYGDDSIRKITIQNRKDKTWVSIQLYKEASDQLVEEGRPDMNALYTMFGNAYQDYSHQYGNKFDIKRISFSLAKGYVNA